MNGILHKAREVCKDVLTLERLPVVIRDTFDPLRLQSNELDKERELFLDEVERAKQEWLMAKANFQQVSEQDLVDQAVFAMAAAEKKYIYLLKEAQKQQIFSDYLYTGCQDSRL